MSDGKPEVTWEPDLGSERIYRIEGKKDLSDPKWLPEAAGHRFFRVTVGMPE